MYRIKFISLSSIYIQNLTEQVNISHFVGQKNGGTGDHLVNDPCKYVNNRHRIETIPLLLCRWQKLQMEKNNCCCHIFSVQ